MKTNIVLAYSAEGAEGTSIPPGLDWGCLERFRSCIITVFSFNHPLTLWGYPTNTNLEHWGEFSSRKMSKEDNKQEAFK